MDVTAVANELRVALDTIPGLNVPPFGDVAGPPAALVALPGDFDYDATYGRGKDTWRDWPIVVWIGSASTRGAFHKAAGYASGSGPQSVKAAIEAGTYTACDRPRVTGGQISTDFTLAGATGLAVIFKLIVTGKGVA
jgi:hypothetical protein